jgi:hypothetical protein
MGDLTTRAVVRVAVPRLAAVADAEVDRLISEASDLIETWCNRTFAQATFTETYDADGSGRLFLRQRPVVSITSITAGLPSGATVLDPASYTFDARTGEVRGAGTAQFFPGTPFSAGPFAPWGFQSVQVVYVASYGTIPAAVAGRCLAVVNRAATWLAGDPLVTSQKFGAVAVTLDRSAAGAVLTDEDRKALSPYRIYSL